MMRFSQDAPLFPEFSEDAGQTLSASQGFAQKPTPHPSQWHVPTLGKGLMMNNTLTTLGTVSSHQALCMDDIHHAKRLALQEELAAHELLVTQLKLLGMEDMEDYTEHLNAVARCYFQLKMMNTHGLQHLSTGIATL
jgi:hypothetical protein